MFAYFLGRPDAKGIKIKEFAISAANMAKDESWGQIVSPLKWNPKFLNHISFGIVGNVNLQTLNNSKTNLSV